MSRGVLRIWLYRTSTKLCLTLWCRSLKLSSSSYSIKFLYYHMLWDNFANASIKRLKTSSRLQALTTKWLEWLLHFCWNSGCSPNCFKICMKVWLRTTSCPSGVYWTYNLCQKCFTVLWHSKTGSHSLAISGCLKGMHNTPNKVPNNFSRNC